jgi:hypothetical protein
LLLNIFIGPFSKIVLKVVPNEKRPPKRRWVIASVLEEVTLKFYIGGRLMLEPYPIQSLSHFQSSPTREEQGVFEARTFFRFRLRSCQDR